MKIALQNDRKVMTVAYPCKLKNALGAREIIKK